MVTCQFVIKKGYIKNTYCSAEIKSFVSIKNGKSFSNNYCPQHGCRICGYSELKSQYKNPKEDFKTNFGEEVCSLECKNTGEEEHYHKEAKFQDKVKQEISEKLSQLDSETITEIKNIFAPFYEIIKEARMNELRAMLLKEKIQFFAFQKLCPNTIDINSSLEPTEKEEWKKIYERVSSWKDLINTCLEEKKFLISLAKKYKDEEEKAQRDNIPECKKCQLRREQPNTWPVNCEGWCKECINNKQREEQKPNNDINDNTKTPSFDNSSKNNSPTNSDKSDNFSPTSDNSSSQTSDSDNRERERERERERDETPHGKKNLPPGKQNDSKLTKKADNAPIYWVSGTIGVVIVVGGIAAYLTFKKRNNGRFRRKRH